MLSFLINRPIAVFMSFLALMIFSIIAATQLPVSLLPDIEVPKIVVRVRYANASPAEVEKNVLKQLRENLSTLNHLKEVESTAANESGTVRLRFEFGAPMNLAYIEANEKIDRLTNSLPQGMERPQVIKINTSDIPVIKIHVVPKDQSRYTEISELTEKVLKKRLEQINGVSLVDLNGLRHNVVEIHPDSRAISALGFFESDLVDAVQAYNAELGSLSVVDGHYRYFIKMTSKLKDLNNFNHISLRTKEGQLVPLHKVAKILQQEERPQGFHLFNKEEGLVVTVHKQAQAQMNKLMPEIYQSIEFFKQEYPEAEFTLSADQSELLNAGIDNLTTSLIYGAIFAFGVLFFFMGNYRVPLIIGIALPTSLILSVLFFYFFRISINIISLSGLALGLGMLIDNAIIVLDNINRKKQQGFNLVDSCIKGTEEVMAPLTSSVLTTLAVFVPLVFMDGLSGALFFDQAVSVAVILTVSLLVSFILLPLVYKILFSANNKGHLEDSKAFTFTLHIYKRIFNVVYNYKAVSLSVLFALIPLSLYLFSFLPKEGLPPVDKHDLLVNLNWNEPVDVRENMERVKNLQEKMEGQYVIAESDVGLTQYLLSNTSSESTSSNMYFSFADQQSKEEAVSWLHAYMTSRFPKASVLIEDAPNAFDQIFKSGKPYYELRWKDLKTGEPLEDPKYLEELHLPLARTSDYKLGKGFLKETALLLEVDHQKLLLYGVNPDLFKRILNKSFGQIAVTEINSFGTVTKIILPQKPQGINEILTTTNISSAKGQVYPLSLFVKVSYEEGHRFITADRSGIYQSLEWDNKNITLNEDLQDLKKAAALHGLNVEAEGSFFEDREQLRKLGIILIISVLLLYFILAAQFESFTQPFIVVFTLPLGIGGSLLILLLTGSSLNIMSAIGIVVMLGIMVNDAILKIDTINRKRKELGDIQEKSLISLEIMDQAIKYAGEVRLKPILMTSITTILALLPILFSSGIGADLQKPLVYSVIGGLTLGTFAAIFFVPLAYRVVK
jgi:multidrug efflux pump subunit AcrB